MNKQSAELLEKQFGTVVDSLGGIKKLRELILTLAMQGKLVEQYPDELAEKIIENLEAGLVAFREITGVLEGSMQCYSIVHAGGLKQAKKPLDTSAIIYDIISYR
jgi:hypothetical protein